ncbi:Nn.00g117080.m01.CDS01 [Neocucurbitaria sp. VM-36]
MSLPTPHIQALSTYKAQLRTPSSSRRNISSPYSLAIPPNNKRTSTSTSANSEARTKPASTSTKSLEKLQVPGPPKKAVLVTEKPIKPCVSNDRSISTTSSQYGYASSYVPTRKRSKFSRKINDRVLALAVTLGLTLLLALIIPLGIILPQKMIKPLPIQVIVPLYMNPELGAWGRLYDAIVRHPDTNFTVIINPDSGPGSATWPSATYIAAIKALDVHLNVKTLGYIDTAGGTRDNATIRSEIATYSGWAKVSDKLAINGIYFDHTPWKYADDVRAYLKNISATVRHSEGFGDEAMVVHNPGRVPDEGLMAYKPDLTVVFEGVYEDMPRKNKLHDLLDGSKSDRAERAMLVNSVPKDLGTGGLRKIVDDVRREVEWLFVTDLSEDVYAGYGSIWEQWLNVMW